MLGIIFGGNSKEHDISIITAYQLKRRLDTDYDILMIYIDYNNDSFIANKVSLLDFKDNKIRKLKKASFKKGGFGKYNVDCMLLAGHGKNSEDGLFASVCDFYLIPYVGVSSLNGGLFLDKWYTYLALKELGVSVVETNRYLLSDFLSGKKPESYPVIIKPCDGGSSIGIEIANDDIEFTEAMVRALDSSDAVIVQPYYKDVIEYNIALSESDSSYLEKIDKKDLIFSFTNKYNESFKLFHQDISYDTLGYMEVARRIYDTFQMSGIVRFDFFNIDGTIYLNEVNTTPGALAMYLFSDFDLVIRKCINRTRIKIRPVYKNSNYLSGMEINK